MKSGSRFRRTEIIYSLILVAVLLFTYAPLVRAKYGFGDDFVVLLADKAVEGGAYLSDGRPAYALAQFLVHRRIETLDQFGYLRFATSLAITGIALVFFRQLRNVGGTRIEHLGLAIMLGTLPCLHTYVAQALIWLGAFTGLCVLWATMITFKATEGTTQPFRLLSPRYLPPLLLMLVASAAYQPMLSWYWTLVVIYLLDRRYLTSARYRKRVYAVIAAGFVFFLVCFLAFKFYFVVFDSQAKSRAELTHDPLYKVYWFLRIQLPLALNFWHLMDSSKRFLTLTVALISLLLIVAGYIVSCFRFYQRPKTASTQTPRFKLILERTFLIVMVVMLTHVHWLAIDISPQSYRLIAPLGVATLILAYWSLRQLSALLPDLRVAVRVRQAVMVLASLATVLACQHYSEKYWIAPHSTAYRYMLLSIREGVHDDIDRIHLIGQGKDDGLVSEWFIECFGRPATERPWTIDSMVKSALRDSGVDHHIKKITHGDASEPIPNDPNVVVIDMRKMAQFRLQK